MKPEEIDRLLRSDVELAWRPELTAAVMVGVRQERVRARWFMAAAAALILLTAGVGALALTTGLELTGAGPRIAARVPPVDTVRESIGLGWSWLGERVEVAAAPLAVVPRGPGIALAVAAIILLVLVNGATLGRPALARRRNP